MSEQQNYIYLLQEREFIKTNENIYKIGMTKKENFTRFNQYPKGSVLLFQIICENCQEMEKQVLKMFREKFIQKTEIGNEYFQGNYTDMIDVIYFVIKHENTCKPPETVTAIKPKIPKTVKPRKKPVVEKPPQKTEPVEEKQPSQKTEPVGEKQPSQKTEPVGEKQPTTLNNTATEFFWQKKEPFSFSHKLPIKMPWQDEMPNEDNTPWLKEHKKRQEEQQIKEFESMRKMFEINRLLFPNGV